jgi:hypothetical protein
MDAALKSTNLAVTLARLSGFAGAISIAACSSLPQLGAPIADYSAANLLSQSGYSQEMVDENHYKVRATGTEATPAPRLEKIARARAAEIGVEGKKKYFKVTGVQPSYKCAKGTTSYKGGGTTSSSRPVIALDVVYAAEPSDQGFLSSAETFKALTAELSAEAVPADATAAAIQQSKAACGQI